MLKKHGVITKMFKKKTKICLWCGRVLETKLERITRACNKCSRKVQTGFQNMSEGKIKEGFKEAMSVPFARNLEQGKQTISGTIKRQRKKIISKAKRKGISEEETKEALKMFDEATKK